MLRGVWKFAVAKCVVRFDRKGDEVNCGDAGESELKEVLVLFWQGTHVISKRGLCWFHKSKALWEVSVEKAGLVSLNLSMLNIFRFVSVVCFPICFLGACKGEDETGGGVTVEETAKTERKKRPKMSEVMQAARELDAYKEKIGYKDSPEIEALSQEQADVAMKVANMRTNHPTLQAISKEGEEAKAKLMEAVSNKDEAGKKKWGLIVGENSTKRLEAAKDIPELVELEKRSEELEEQIEKLRYEAISKEPEGKKLVDRNRELGRAYSEGY